MSRSRSTRRPTPFRLVSLAVIAVVAALIAYPFARVVWRLFWVDGAPSADPVVRAFTAPGVGELVRDSTLVVVTAGACAVLAGSLLAWLNERTDARIPGVTDIVPLMPFLLPSIAMAIGWTLLLSPGAGLLNVLLRNLLGLVGVEIENGPLNIFSMPGMIFCYFVVLVPYVFLFVSAGLRSMPGDLEEQARVAGAGTARAFRRVTLPGLKPSIAAASVIVVWFGFAMFSIPLIIGTPAQIDVLTVRIVRLINFTYPPRTDLAVSLSLFILVIVGGAWALQVRIMKSGMFAQVGGRGGHASTLRLGRLRWPARVLVAGFLVVSGVLPVLGLLITALNGFWTPDINWSGLGFASFRRVWEDGPTVAAFGNSLLLGAVAGTGIILFAALMAVHVRRSGGVVTRLLEAAIRLPIVVSGFIVVVGMILAYSGPPFALQGTFALFVIAYMATSIPQASIVSDAAAAQVGDDMAEAAAVSGAGEGRTFGRVQLPLMAPGLVAGWTLVFVNITGDMEVASMLGSSRQPVVGFQLLDTYNKGEFADLAAMALMLVLLTTLCVLVGTGLGRRLSGRSERRVRTARNT
ncbi:ABC transporter permease subunit [Actinomadura sp. NPDC000600]|uniref:ABC transporter permease n=1 Tax=Actinomadura sp. NPDC000600 TaxID=3154262 RepID=UPI00339315A3